MKQEKPACLTLLFGLSVRLPRTLRTSYLGNCFNSDLNFYPPCFPLTSSPKSFPSNNISRVALIGFYPSFFLLFFFFLFSREFFRESFSVASRNRPKRLFSASSASTERFVDTFFLYLFSPPVTADSGE